MSACEEKEPAAFQEISGIYFNNRTTGNVITDSTSVTFVYIKGDVLEVPVNVQVLGRPAESPRPVDIRVAGGNGVEGVDYELKTAAEIPAGAVGMDYVVELKRTAALKQESRELVLELKANDWFSLPFDYRIQAGNDTTTVVSYRIIFTDRFTVAPDGWDESFGGTFSQQKFELICRVLDLDPALFKDKGGISPERENYILLEMPGYMKEQVAKKEAGEDYDAEAFDPQTGEPLTFGKKEEN